jgi:DNA-binding NarL/FixJ family response regulator
VQSGARADPRVTDEYLKSVRLRSRCSENFGSSVRWTRRQTGGGAGAGCPRGILRAVEAGATGYLLKDTPRRELADAVRAAARGETVLAPPVAAKLVTRVRGAGPELLTPREVEVLGCVARGLSNAETGRVLFITEATVKTHLLRAFEKLGVNDRTAAVTVGIARGVLPPP